MKHAMNKENYLKLEELLRKRRLTENKISEIEDYANEDPRMSTLRIGVTRHIGKYPMDQGDVISWLERDVAIALLEPMKAKFEKKLEEFEKQIEEITQ